MSKEVTDALSKKDADFLERFVFKVLKLAADFWGQKAAKAMEEARAKRATDSKEELALQSYYQTFDEWFRLRLNIVHIEEEIARGADRLSETEGEALEVPPWELTEDTVTSKSPISEEG